MLRRKVILYFILAAYWLTIFILTSIPAQSMPSIKISDKINHFLAYFILSGLFYVTANIQTRFKNLARNPIFWTAIVVSLYAITDELHQMLIPGRLCEFYDLLANFIGIVIGIAFGFMVIKSLSLKKIFS